MDVRHLLQMSVLAGAALAQGQAAAQNQPPRWVTADGVLVRATPDASGAVVGKWNRGAQVTLKAPEQDNGYCFVEGEGNYGYAACKYLSVDRVERARAGENGIDAAQRWIAGNGVVVRAAANREAEVAGRLSLNAIVKLVGEDGGKGYCEIQAAGGLHGYTACRYLAATPVIVADLVDQSQPGQTPSTGADPARLFWLDPGWGALQSYAQSLKTGNPENPAQGPWPRDENLERMKAHLALGIKGAKPKPYKDWTQLKRVAIDMQELDDAAARFEKKGEAVPQELARKRRLAESALTKLDYDYDRSAYLPDLPSEHPRQTNASLMQALNFPAVQPSLFRSQMELASGETTAEQASGRFGIVYRVLTKPRPKAGTQEADSYLGAGVYDMLSVTTSLVKPVHHVRLYRDGRLTVDPSYLRNTGILWGDTDGPECEGWVPGFAHGSAESAMWKLIGYPDGGAPKENQNPPGSLYEFYTTLDLPRERASVNLSEAKLDLDATGFIGGTTLLYDFDGDGIPDMAVWEGRGKGPGAVEVEGTPNDIWYRLVLVNIDGAWKLLGSDQFGYGCGC